MVFKGRFFSSSKKSDSSSPDGSNSNSPRSLASNSPLRSDKKKPKSSSKDDNPSTFRQTQAKDGLKKKDSKDKQTITPTQTPSKPTKTFGSGSGSKEKKEATPAEPLSQVSPILASSLGLNRIKTRSGPLPQESFFGFRGGSGGDKGSALGASNLSRPGNADAGSGLGSGSGGKKKEVAGPSSRMLGFQEHWVDNASNSDSMSTGSAPSRDQSPIVVGRSRLQNGESSSQAGMVFLFSL